VIGAKNEFIHPSRHLVLLVLLVLLVQSGTQSCL